METKPCGRCGRMLIWFLGTWHAYPLMHGPGSSILQAKRNVCYTKWIFFEYPHKPAGV